MLLSAALHEPIREKKNPSQIAVQNNSGLCQDKSMAKIFSISSIFIVQTLIALPQGSVIEKGFADMVVQNGHLSVNTAEHTVIQWEDFSIKPEERVSFLQPDSASVVLNRVIGSNLSEIMGRLESNGQFILVNQNGILVGKEAVIDTGSFIASTLDPMEKVLLARENMARNRTSFTIEGVIKAADSVQLKSTFLENRGTISANNISLIAESTLQHTGSIISQKSVSLECMGGVVSINGKIFAKTLNDYGGTVRVFGKENRLLGDSLIDVSGNSQGGTLLIGGEYQGKGLSVSERTYVESGAQLLANALEYGDGGQIVVWGNEFVNFDGIIASQGGLCGGNGGLVEISSKGQFSLTGLVNTTAPKGNVGKLLLDPTTVVISTAADSGILTMPPPGYVFNAATANIDAAVLSTLLLTNDVEINASTSGSAPVGSITLNANADAPAGTAIVWNAASPTRLRLIADGFIDIRNGILSQNTTALAATPIIEISAPTVTIGDPSLTLGNSAIVQVTKGRIEVNASSSLNIYGNAVTSGGIIAGTPAPANLASIEINAGSITCISGAVITLITANGNVDINAAGNIQISSGTAPSGIQTVNPNGAIYVRGQGNLSFQGGSGVNSSCAVVANFGGLIDISIAGDYLLQGGSAAMDGNAGISINSGTGTLRLSGRNYFLTGGTAGSNNNISAIGLVNTGSGTVDVTATGSVGIVCDARFSNGCGFIISPSIGSNSMTIRTTHLTLNGSPDVGAMQGGAQVLANSGDVFVQASGNIYLNGGQGTGLNIGAIINNGSGSTTISANHLFAAGGTSTFSVGGIIGFAGPVTASFLGDCNMTGGSGLLSLAVIGASATSGTGNLTVTASNIIATGGSGLLSHAGFFTGDVTTGAGGGNGSIFITSNGPLGITLTGGSGAPSFGAIGTYGNASTNNIHVIARGNLVMDSPNPNGSATIFTETGGSIDLSIGQNVSLTDTPGALSNIRVGAGGNSNLTVLAGNSISVNSSIENLGLGNLFLVVDANFSSPFFGNGAFILGPNGTINTSGGSLQIYTSMQSLNSINGLLNGFSFTPGALFIDSSQEAWCVYYPFGTGGFPFIVYYKQCLQELAYQASVISDEALDDLHPANENPGWHARFQMADSDSQDSWLIHYLIRRRHLRSINLPKDYTSL